MYSILTKQWQQKLANNGIDTTNQVKDYIKERKAKSISECFAPHPYALTPFQIMQRSN